MIVKNNLIGDKFEYMFGKAFEFSSFKLFLYLSSLINFSMLKIKTGNAHNSKEKILKRGNRLYWRILSQWKENLKYTKI